MAVIVATLLASILAPYITKAYNNGEMWNQNGIIQVFVDVESIELADHPDLYTWTVELDRVPMHQDPHQGTRWIGSYPIDLDWEKQDKRRWRSSGSMNLPVEIVDSNTNDPTNKGMSAATFVVSLWLGPKEHRYSGELSSVQTILARRMVTIRSQQPVSTVSLIARAPTPDVISTGAWSVSTALLSMGKAILLLALGLIAWGAWLNHREKVEAWHQVQDADYQYRLRKATDNQYHHEDRTHSLSPVQQQYPPRVTPCQQKREPYKSAISRSFELDTSSDEDYQMHYTTVRAGERTQSSNGARWTPVTRTVRFHDEAVHKPAVRNRGYTSNSHDWTTFHEERSLNNDSCGTGEEAGDSREVTCGAIDVNTRGSSIQHTEQPVYDFPADNSGFERQEHTGHPSAPKGTNPKPNSSLKSKQRNASGNSLAWVRGVTDASLPFSGRIKMVPRGTPVAQQEESRTLAETRIEPESADNWVKNELGAREVPQRSARFAATPQDIPTNWEGSETTDMNFRHKEHTGDQSEEPEATVSPQTIGASELLEYQSDQRQRESEEVSRDVRGTEHHVLSPSEEDLSPSGEFPKESESKPSWEDNKQVTCAATSSAILGRLIGHERSFEMSDTNQENQDGTRTGAKEQVAFVQDDREELPQSHAPNAQFDGATVKDPYTASAEQAASCSLSNVPASCATDRGVLDCVVFANPLSAQQDIKSRAKSRGCSNSHEQNATGQCLKQDDMGAKPHHRVMTMKRPKPGEDAKLCSPNGSNRCVPFTDFLVETKRTPDAIACGIGNNATSDEAPPFDEIEAPPVDSTSAEMIRRKPLLPESNNQGSNSTPSEINPDQMQNEGTIENKKHPHGVINSMPSPSANTKNTMEKISTDHQPFEMQPQRGRPSVQAQDSAQSLAQSCGTEGSLQLFTDRETDRQVDGQDWGSLHDRKFKESRTQGKSTATRAIASCPTASDPSRTIGERAKNGASQNSVSSNEDGMPGTVAAMLNSTPDSLLPAETNDTSQAERNNPTNGIQAAKNTSLRLIRQQKSAAGGTPSSSEEDGYSSQISSISPLPPGSNCSPMPDAIDKRTKTGESQKGYSPKEHGVYGIDEAMLNPPSGALLPAEPNATSSTERSSPPKEVLTDTNTPLRLISHQKSAVGSISSSSQDDRYNSESSSIAPSPPGSDCSIKPDAICQRAKNGAPQKAASSKEDGIYDRAEGVLNFPPGAPLPAESNDTSPPERNTPPKEIQAATNTPLQVISKQKSAAGSNPSPSQDSQASYISTLPPHSDCSPTPEAIANLQRPAHKTRKTFTRSERAILDFDSPNHEDAEHEVGRNRKGLRSFSSKLQRQTARPDKKVTRSHKRTQEQYSTPIPSKTDADEDDSVQFVKAIRLTDPVPDATLSCSLKSAAKKLGQRKMWEVDDDQGKDDTAVPKAAATKKRKNLEENSSSKRAKTKFRRKLFPKK